MTTNTITHHLTDQILIAYAAGTLPEAFNLIVATHITMCDQCRTELAAHEAVGGAVLERAGVAEMDVGALDACFARIDADPKDPIKVRGRSNRPPSLFPQPLADYVGCELEDIKWKPVGLGVRQSILKASRTASVRLLHIPAGCEVPDHGHNGTEMTLVLQGAFCDEFARFGPGDIEICDPNVEHNPIAEDGLDCICLAATDAPLKFSGLLPKIAQPFLRI